MAGFEVTLYGRIWVTTKASKQAVKLPSLKQRASEWEPPSVLA